MLFIGDRAKFEHVLYWDRGSNAASIESVHMIQSFCSVNTNFNINVSIVLYFKNIIILLLFECMTSIRTAVYVDYGHRHHHIVAGGSGQTDKHIISKMKAHVEN